MKKRIALVMVLCLMMSCAAALAETSLGRISQDVLTYTGPGTGFFDTGVTLHKGTYVTVLSKTWDYPNNMYWIQIEFGPQRDRYRAYISDKCFAGDLSRVPEEESLGVVYVTSDADVFAGPGWDYVMWNDTVYRGTSAVLLAALMHNTESWCSLKPWLNEDCTQFTAWGLLCLVWWLAAEHWRGSRGFYRDYSELGVPAMLFYLMLVQVPLLYTCIWPEDEAVLAKLLVLIPLVLLLRPKDICWGIWWQMVVLLSLPLPVGFMLCDARVELPGVLCGFAMGGWLMYLGYAAKRISWLNYGSLMVVFAGIALIANVLDSLTGSGLVLIIAGLLMLGLVWVLEKQRRVLVGAIREKA